MPTAIPAENNFVNLTGTKLLLNENLEKVVVKAQEAKQISPDKVKLTKGKVEIDSHKITSNGNPIDDRNKVRIMLDKGMTVEDISNAMSTVQRNDRERAIAARKE